MVPDDLDAVLAVVDAGTFSAAAARLHLSQPALSRRIARLERELGGRLFDRLPRHASVTALGREVADAAVRISAELRRAQEDALAVSRGAAGRVRMSSLAGGIPALAEGIVRFQTRRPDVWLELRTLSADEAVHALREREVDLATLPGSALEPDLRSRKLARWRVVLAVRPDHPFAGRASVGIAQLAAEPLLMLAPEFMVTRHVQEAAARAGLRLKVRLADGTPEAVLSLARRGWGVGVLPDAVRLPATVAAVPLTTRGPSTEFDYTIAWLADRTLPPAADELIASLVRETAAFRARAGARDRP